jgi:hypothetical protein
MLPHKQRLYGDYECLRIQTKKEKYSQKAGKHRCYVKIICLKWIKQKHNGLVGICDCIISFDFVFELKETVPLCKGLRTVVI